MTLCLFIGWHGSSKRGAWQLCRSRGRPASLAQAWGCQVALSKDMSVPCQNHVRTMSLTFQDHTSTMSIPRQYLVSTMSGPCRYHVSTMSGPCQDHVRTMSGPCQHHVSIYSMLMSEVSTVQTLEPLMQPACQGQPISLGQCEHSTRCCSVRGLH